jgi:hypothetical protein
MFELLSIVEATRERLVALREEPLLCVIDVWATDLLFHLLTVRPVALSMPIR